MAGRRQLSELVIGSQEYVLKVTCILNWEIYKYIKELALQVQWQHVVLPCWKLPFRLTMQLALLKAVAKSSTSSISRYEARKDNF